MQATFKKQAIEHEWEDLGYQRPKVPVANRAVHIPQLSSGAIIGELFNWELTIEEPLQLFLL